ncbi:MAG TPA: hypothetical protein VLK85_12990 [Ramlibacter sp.]|nr:hypothetical protein [Ramlibacter sp.]
MRGYVALALALIIAALLAGAFAWGGHVKDNAWQAKQAKAEREQAAKYQAEVQRADTAAAVYLSDHREQEERYEALDVQFKAFRKRLPLVAAARVAVDAAAAPAAAATPAPDRQAEAPGRIELPDAGPPLSLGAIWMWNSALAGRDVPAGACDAAAATGGSEAACAIDSGLGLQDAWDNHRANARSCARDREKLRHLINYLQERSP